MCRRIVGDAHLADDAFQASFLVLARKADSVRGGNLAGWLFRVALRARKRSVADCRRESVLETEPVAVADPDPIETREHLAILDEEIAGCHAHGFAWACR